MNSRLTTSIPARLVVVCAAVPIAIGIATLFGGCKHHSVAVAPRAATQSATMKVTAPAGVASRGKALFAANCAKCHGIEGEGLSKKLPIKNVGPDLQTDNFLKVRTDAQLVTFIERGRASNNPKDKRKIGMPAKGGNPALTNQDIRDIVAYLRQVQKQHPAAK